MSIMSYNGGVVLAVRGKNCVLIGGDTRFGQDAQMVKTDFNRVFRINDACWIGYSGLVTDVQTFHNLLQFRLKLYTLREHRDIGVKALGALVASMLYEKRFGMYFIEPIVAGMHQPVGGGPLEPYITGFDLIGAPVVPDDFVVAGTAEENVYGMIEALANPEAGPEELFEVFAQCLLSGMDRDARTGLGVTVSVVTPDTVTVKNVRARSD